MATLDQTLQIFRALLSAGQNPGVSEADDAIWAYLTPIQGLHAQSAALDTLTREVEALTDRSPPLMAALLDDLNRHRERLDQSLSNDARS